MPMVVSVGTQSHTRYRPATMSAKLNIASQYLLKKLFLIIQPPLHSSITKEKIQNETTRKITSKAPIISSHEAISPQAWPESASSEDLTALIINGTTTGRKRMGNTNSL